MLYFKTDISYLFDGDEENLICLLYNKSAELNRLMKKNLPKKDFSKGITIVITTRDTHNMVHLDQGPCSCVSVSNRRPTSDEELTYNVDFFFPTAETSCEHNIDISSPLKLI